MRKLAELAMKSPKHSLFLVVLFACLPAVYWLSAALVSLVILRRGVDHGLKVLMWALLPGIVWAAFGQFSTLIALVSTSVLACVLRQTASWQKTLLALVPVGAGVAGAMFLLSPDLIAIISQAVVEFLGKSFKLENAQQLDQIRPMLEFVIAGTLATFHGIFAALSLILAPTWQAALYNPGGFGEEYCQVRIPATAGIFLLALTLMGSAVSPLLVTLTPVATLPLFFAGMALIHGLVKLRGLGSFWLIGTYVLLITITQLAYPVIVLTACLDSLFDFRSRMANKAQD